MENRRELIRNYKETPIKGGVYQIKNTVNGKICIIATPNLKTITGRKFELSMGGYKNEALQKMTLTAKFMQTHEAPLDLSNYDDIREAGLKLEKHAVAKLVGAPPGYVGYEEAGQLTEKVRRNPYSLILLDEVEKAHPDVMHMFLQVLDDGRLTDGQGRTVSFKDTIIIMTSNAGTGKVEASVGFGAAMEGRTQSVLGQLGNFFTPEFMNR